MIENPLRGRKSPVFIGCEVLDILGFAFTTDSSKAKEVGSCGVFGSQGESHGVLLCDIGFTV